MSRLIVLTLCLVVLSGCAQTRALLAKRDNGSLDYTRAQKLDPIRIPDGVQTLPFTPLYATPDSGVAAPVAGKQYQLPTPPNTIAQ